MKSTLKPDSRKHVSVAWKGLAIGVVITLAIFFIGYSLHGNFKETLIFNYNSQQTMFLKSLEKSIRDHIQEEQQDLQLAADSILISDNPLAIAAEVLPNLLQIRSNDFCSIKLLDEKGRVLYSPAKTETEDFQAMIQLRKALDRYGQDGRPFLSERYVSKEGCNAVALFVPFMTSHGDERQYFIVAELTIEEHIKAHFPVWEGKSTGFVLVDNDGFVLAMMDTSHETDEAMKSGNAYHLSDNCLECHKSDDFKDMREALATGEVVHSIYQVPKTDATMNRSTVPFPIYNEIWSMSIFSPFESVQEAVDRNFTYALTLTLLALSMIFTLGYIVYRSHDLQIANEKMNALNLSEEKFRTLFESVSDGIFLLDIKGNFIDVNHAAYERLGYTKEEMLSLHISTLDPPEFAAQVPERLAEIKEFGKAVFESGHKRKDGTVMPVEVNSRVVTFEGRQVFLSVIRDITQRKEEEKLRKNLEERIQARQRMDSLGTLAGGIAHDFNNILLGIMGNLSLLTLDRHNLTEQQKGFVKTAEDGCERAADLIRHFQRFSGTSSIEKECIDIHDIAAEVFTLLDKTTDRLIEKRVAIPPGRFFVNVNASDLHQVLLNLGTNSVLAISEHGMEPGGFVRVQAMKKSVSSGDKTGLSEGEYVHIVFEDNGCGMSKEVALRVFEPMFTTREKSARKGQGLGLAMVYSIVSQSMGGRISLESEEGKGTTFHIYLPKSDAVEKIVSEKEGELRGGHETILVVDDDAAALGFIENALSAVGYQVLTAVDGVKALEVYREKKDSIDVILLDLIMPNISGEAVLHRILEMRQDAKILISTGQIDRQSTEAELAKAKGIITKPFKVEEIITSVRKVLDSC